MMTRIIITTPEELSAMIDERIRLAFKYHAPDLVAKPKAEDEIFVSKRQAARILSCSVSSVENAARAGKINRHNVGKSVRFLRTEVVALAKLKEK